MRLRAALSFLCLLWHQTTALNLHVRPDASVARLITGISAYDLSSGTSETHLLAPDDTCLMHTLEPSKTYRLTFLTFTHAVGKYDFGQILLEISDDGARWTALLSTDGLNHLTVSGDLSQGDADDPSLLTKGDTFHIPAPKKNERAVEKSTKDNIVSYLKSPLILSCLVLLPLLLLMPEIMVSHHCIHLHVIPYTECGE